MTETQIYLLFLGPALALLAGGVIFGLAMIDEVRYRRSNAQRRL